MEREGRRAKCTVINILSEQSGYNGLANPGPFPPDFHACCTLSSRVRQGEAGSPCFGAVLRRHERGHKHLNTGGGCNPWALPIL